MSRFLKLLISITALLLISALVAGYIYLRSAAFDHWIQEQITAYLESHFPVRVELEAVAFEPFRWSVHLDKLRLFSTAYPDPNPAVEVEEADVNFEVLHFLSPRIRLDRLTLKAPVVRLFQDPNGKLNLTNLFAPRTPPGIRPQDAPGRTFSPVQLAIGEIEVSRGDFYFDDTRIRFDTQGQRLETSMRFDPAQQAYSGSLSLQGFALLVNDLPLPATAIQTDFTLFDNRLDLHDTIVTAEPLEVRLSGEIADLRRLHYAFDLSGDIQLPRLQQPDLSRVFDQGALSTSGHLSGEGASVLYRGTIRAAELVTRGFPIRDLTATVQVDGQSLELTDLAGRIPGGAVSGQARLFWHDSPSSLTLACPQLQLPPTLARFGLAHLPIRGTGALSAALEWPALQFSRLTGRIHTSYQGQFTTGPTGAIGAAEPPVPLPFQGTADVGLADGRFTTEHAVITTPESRGDYSLSFDTSGQVEVAADLTTGDAAEWMAISTRFGLLPPDFAESYPLALDGPAKARLSLTRQPTTPLTLEATLSAADFSYRGRSLGPLSTEIRYDAAGLRFEHLRLAADPYELLASLRWSDRSESEPPFTSEIALRDVPLPLLSAVFPEANLPTEGQMTGRVRIAYGSEGGLAASGKLDLRQVSVAGEALDALTGSFQLDKGILTLDRIQAEIFGGQVRGEGSYSFADSRFKGSVSGTELQFARIAALRDLPALDGFFNLQASGQGSVDAPRLTVEIASPEISVAEQTIRRLLLQGTSSDDTARFQASGEILGETLALQGEVSLQAPYAFHIRQAVQPLDLRRLVEELAGLEGSELEGRVAVGWSAKGAFSGDTPLRVDATLGEADFTARGYRLRSQGSADIHYQDGRLRVTGLSLRGQGTDLRANGEIDWRQTPQVTARVEGNVNLELVNAFVTSATIGGLAELQTDIVGPLDGPRIAGTAQIRQASFSSLDWPLQVTEAQGALKFTANQISVDEFSLRTQYGLLNLDGGIFLEGFTPNKWQLNAYGYGLRFDQPKNVQSLVDVDLDLIKSDHSQLISGAVYVRSAEYARDLSLADFVIELARTQAVAPAASSEEKIALDIDIEAYRSIRIDNNLADVVGSADCSLIGSIENPVLIGSLVIDEGQLFLEGNEYDFNRGTITFSNPRKTTPFFNLEAKTDVREFTVTVLLRGPSDNLKVSFRSDPPLATSSIVSLLTAGQTQEEIFGTDQTGKTASGTLAVYGAGTLLSKTLGERIQSQTSRLFGFEKFSIDPFLDSSRSRDPGARITLGKQLTKKLGLTYMTTLGQELQGQTLIVQYRLTDWVTLVGTSESDGSVALDFKFRKRF